MMKKSYFKKILIAAVTVAAVFALSACGAKDDDFSEAVRVAALNGPTGMGLIDLQDNENVELQTYQAPDEVVQKLISGDIDVACLPSNMGAVLNAKTEGNVKVLATVVNGVLYMVENGDSVKSIKDLKGKTVVASGKGGTPEYVLQTLVEAEGMKLGEDVQVEWMDAHADVAQKLLTTEGAVALLPEPFVSTVSSKSEAVNIAVDMNDAWFELTEEELPMGILVAKKDFAENRKDDVELLLGLVRESIKDVNSADDAVVKKIVDAGFLADPEICKAVIPRCSMVCLTEKDNLDILNTFYKKMFEVAPQAVGGDVPEDSLYYGFE